jgi:cbb3-type cytochrome c oxidase subunit III
MPTISSFSIRAARIVLLVLVMTAAGSGLCSAGQSRGLPNASSTGAELFNAGCAGCHGPTGAGMPDSTIGFEKPTTFPDFSQCDQTTPEVEADWWAVIHDGGKARGFSRIMPAFGDLLTAPQISALVKHLRSLCQDRSWPIGELNFPRPLNTEKAFPESETVITTTVGARRVHDVTSTLGYEKRLGIKDQLEVSIPFSVMHEPSGTAIGGIGDIGIGLKHVLFSSTGAGSILSVQGEVIAPTGNRDKGLGAGVMVFEGFAAFGQRLPHHGFIMGQAGTEQPTDTADTPRAAYGRVAVGKMFRADQGLGRLLTPMVELLANRDFENAATTDLDLVPQIQVTLSQRQHVRASVGVQVPVNHRAGRPVQAGFYLLWDWFDGGLFEGWK